VEAQDKTARWRRWAFPAALVTAGVLAGGVLAGTVTAGADTASPSASSSESGQGSGDESQSRHPDEQLLTGDTATRVREAALAEYPGATIQRVETDSDGVYEAHLITADGQRVTVEIGEDFAVTGTEDAGRGKHGPHGTDSGTDRGTDSGTEGGATPQSS
jgi:hypothetical protein